MLCCIQPPDAQNFSVSIVLKLKLLVENYLRRNISNNGLFPKPPASLGSKLPQLFCRFENNETLL